MSSISSLSSSASGLYSFIQSLSGNNQTSATSPASSTDPTQSASGQAVGAAGAHHHHHGGGGGAMKQIQDAVTNALQTAQSGGSSSDPNQIIEDAIAKVLQNNNGATTGTMQGGTSDPDGDGDGSTGANGAAGTNAQSFQQILQSFGVSPQQFHQDFLAAVKDAQGGQMNPLTAMQSFPVGSTVDTIG
ncbi:MAG TPA: hypothetical protein VGI81_25620 [Tepidisphaeraceae bacterium]|jgi:hypothetical protein